MGSHRSQLHQEHHLSYTRPRKMTRMERARVREEDALRMAQMAPRSVPQYPPLGQGDTFQYNPFLASVMPAMQMAYSQATGGTDSSGATMSYSSSQSSAPNTGFARTESAAVTSTTPFAPVP